MAQITGDWNNIIANEYLFFYLHDLMCIAIIFRNVLNVTVPTLFISLFLLFTGICLPG